MPRWATLPVRQVTAGLVCIPSGCVNSVLHAVRLAGWIYIEQPPDAREREALISLIGMTSSVRPQVENGVEMRTRPDLVFRCGRVILLDWANALENLWLAFEFISNSDPVAYDDHQKRRGRALEMQVRDALTRLFPRSDVFHNVSYPDPERGPGAIAQLDLLVA